MLETCHIYYCIISRTQSPIQKILLSAPLFHPTASFMGVTAPFFTKKIPYILSSDATDAHFNARNLPHLLLHYLQDTIPYPWNIAFTPLPHSWGLQPPFFTKKHIFSALTPLTLTLMLETCHIYYCIISRTQSPIQKILLSPHCLTHGGYSPPFSQKKHIFSALTPLTLTLMLETCHIYYCIISRTQSPIQKILLSPHCLTHGGYSPPFSQKKHIFSALTPLTLTLMLETCHIYYCIISRTQSPIQKILLSPHCLTHGGYSPPFSQKFHIISALTPLTLTLMLETCHIYYCIISRTQSPIQKILLHPTASLMGVTAPLFHKKTYILSSDATDAHFNARNLPHLLLHYLQDTIPYPKNIALTPLPHSWGLQIEQHHDNPT